MHVFIYGTMLARALFSRQKAGYFDESGLGFLLHDIGKKEIPPYILNKKGTLTHQEWEIIKMHPEVGAKILQKSSDRISEKTLEIVLQHHERIDGTGYPRGLKGKQIGLYSRICIIANTFDSLTTNHSYREAMPIVDALALMKERKGEFDGRLLSEFVKIASLAMR